MGEGPQMVLERPAKMAEKGQRRRKSKPKQGADNQAEEIGKGQQQQKKKRENKKKLKEN